MSPADRLPVAVTVEQLARPVPGGSGTYVRALVDALAAGDRVRPLPVAAAGSGDLGLPVPVHRSRLPRRVLDETWGRLGRPRADRLAPGAQVVHATTWAVPGADVPLVVTVHDLAFLRDPSHFTAHGNRFFRRALEVTARRAAAVVVPSAATAADCLAHGLDPARVHVVPHGVSADPGAVARVPAWRARVGLTGRYVLWCGTLEPRKNVPALVEAFAAARRDGLDASLVLVGPDGWGEQRAAVDRVARALPDGAVRLLGRLDEADLQAAYAGADVFAFPSLWEGFGMPVLEAMAHGVPVVTSAGTSTAEVAAGVGVLVDPHDVTSIAKGLLAASASTPDDRVAIRTAAAGYTWAASAAGHAAIYQGVVR